VVLLFFLLVKLKLDLSGWDNPHPNQEKPPEKWTRPIFVENDTCFPCPPPTQDFWTQIEKIKKQTCSVVAAGQMTIRKLLFVRESTNKKIAVINDLI